jgi:outer membrane lipoprotein-sorting protein
MKTNVLFFCLLLFFASGVIAQELTLDQVLDHFYKAGNFEKLRQVNSIIMTGSIVQQDLMPVKIIRVRPDKYMMEFDVADMTAYQAYDGQAAWMTAPWTGNARAQVMPPERMNDLKNRADMDGILVNWKEKGHVLELAGKDTLEGISVYKIKIIRKDGGVEYNFIDSGGFMLRKRTSSRMAGGREVTVESFYRDYRNVEGIPFAFTVETNNGGRVNEIQFESVELNKPIDLKIFTMPDKK